MSDEFKRLLMLLGATAVVLYLGALTFDDYLLARRFVHFGAEKQGTIVALDHIVGGKTPKYVYSLQVDQTLILKTFPYNWTPPLKRSFLVMKDPPGSEDVALGNHASSPLIVLCYMEGCDKPGNLWLYPVIIVGFGVLLPFFWIRFLKTGIVPQIPR